MLRLERFQPGALSHAGSELSVPYSGIARLTMRTLLKITGSGWLIGWPWPSGYKMYAQTVCSVGGLANGFRSAPRLTMPAHPRDHQGRCRNPQLPLRLLFTCIRYLHMIKHLIDEELTAAHAASSISCDTALVPTPLAIALAGSPVPYCLLISLKFALPFCGRP